MSRTLEIKLDMRISLKLIWQQAIKGVAANEGLVVVSGYQIVSDFLLLTFVDDSFLRMIVRNKSAGDLKRG